MNDSCKIIDQKVTPADVTVKWTSVISGVKGLATISAAATINETVKRN